MTSAPTTSKLEKLLAENTRPLISLYMPTHRAGSEIWQDPIRFRTLLRSAEHHLEAAAIPRKEIDRLLEPLLALREDRDFWQHQELGLAVFRSAREMEVFRLRASVPMLAVVGSRFHLKPLRSEPPGRLDAAPHEDVAFHWTGSRGLPPIIGAVLGLDRLPHGRGSERCNSFSMLRLRG